MVPNLKGRCRPLRCTGRTGGLLTVIAVSVIASACGAHQGAARAAASSATTATPATSVYVPAPTTTTSSTLAPVPSTTGPATTTTTAPVPATTTTAAPVPATTTTTAAAAPVAAAAACPSNLASTLRDTGSSRQLITVEARGYGTTYATLETWDRSGGCWMAVAGPWSARIGENGFSDHHIEGDGTSPTGRFPISADTYGNAPDPGVKGTYHRLVCGDWWDEDPRSSTYNTFQHVRCGTTPPFGGGSEALWSETQPYPSFAVIDYNTAPAVPYAGSGIFLHADTASPTDGCVSLPLPELDQVLRWLDPGSDPAMVMAPVQEISRF